MTQKVLIIGAGVSGLLAAQQLASQGVQCLLIERHPVIGGKAAALLDPDADIERTVDAELLAQLRPESLPANIQIMTLCDVTGISAIGSNGTSGVTGFAVSLQQQARFVTDACTRCNHCSSACPQVVANEYDAGLTARKAIHSPYPSAYPAAFSIDIETCLNVPPNYLPCQRCVQVCDDHAIDFAMKPTTTSIEVDAIVLASGDSLADTSALFELGYGRHADCVTSYELQRLLENPGPSGGFAIRPSNEDYPESVLMVLETVSEFTCHLFQRQLQQLKSQDIERVDLMILEQQASGAAIEQLLGTATQLACPVYQAAWLGLDVSDQSDSDSLDINSLDINYLDFADGQSKHQQYDLVVFSLDRQVSPDFSRLAEMLGIEPDAQGYPLKTDPLAGVFVAGSAAGCIGLDRTRQQTQETVNAVLQHIQPGLTAASLNDSATLNSATNPSAPVNLQQLEHMLGLLARLGEGGNG